MEEFVITMVNTHQDAARVIREAEALLSERSFPPRARYTVSLVLEETLTNIIKYAYNDNGSHEIIVRILFIESEICIECIDEGREFNPLHAPDAVLGDSIHEIEEGGLGIHLMRQIVEHMDYRRDGTRNIMTFRICTPVR
jgi:serine/threonine-protein kinase RsbW